MPAFKAEYVRQALVGAVPGSAEITVLRAELKRVEQELDILQNL